MNEKRVTRHSPSWEPMAAFACFAGSIISLALGFALTTNWVLNANRHPVLHGVGLTLLIIGIPLLILGGHCLDLLERRAKRSRSQVDAPENSRTKPLPVGVMLVGSLLMLHVASTKLRAQQATAIERRDSNNTLNTSAQARFGDVG